MQEIRTSIPPVVAGICDPNKSWARHHNSLKLASKLTYLNEGTCNYFKEQQAKYCFKDNYKNIIGMCLALLLIAQKIAHKELKVRKI